MIADLPDPETIRPEEILQSFENKDIDLICVLGPTASGKTRYAVALARELNRLRGVNASEGSVNAGAEILSGDSRQVYRGMDIGTGKDLSEYEEIPYHLIDIVDAGTKFDLYQYQKAFEKHIRTSLTEAEYLFSAADQDSIWRPQHADTQFLTCRNRLSCGPNSKPKVQRSSYQCRQD